MVSTTCRAFSGSVLSRWLLSQRHREGGVLRLVRSIAIKDLVTRLGAALRSTSSSLYIALARCVKQFICIEANAPGVVALPSSLIFPSFSYSYFSLLLFLRGCELAGSVILVSIQYLNRMRIHPLGVSASICEGPFTQNMYICVSAYFFPE